MSVSPDQKALMVIIGPDGKPAPLRKSDLGTSVTVSGTVASAGVANKVSLTSTPTKILDYRDDRIWVLIKNKGPGTAYIAFSEEELNNDKGYPIDPGEVTAIGYKGELYASADTSAEIRYLEGLG